jgi:putative membrane protein
MKKTLIILMAVAAMACVREETTVDTLGTDTAGTYAQTATETMTATPAATEFTTKAAADAMMEVRLGEIAREKAQAPEVKDFAAMMVTDHTKASDELKALAQSKNITVPAELPDDKRQIVDRLSTLSGREFDREYMQAMVDDHQKAVEMFQDASNAADLDQELRTFASSTLPKLQEHLQRAEAIAQKLR